MGSGGWKKNDFINYSRTMGRTVTKSGRVDTSRMRGAQDMYKSRRLVEELDPKNVIRECCDSDEHPETIPVILALDVTGSMGGALLKTASCLNEIMQNVLGEFKDVEFMVMGSGDLYCDNAPIQISQFESDIRIAQHLDRIWFERGGGGNYEESYSAAWYMGAKHTALDCWKRGKKGVIITIGDEPLNTRLPAHYLQKVTGDAVQDDIDTKALYAAAAEKFDIFHIAIDDRDDSYWRYAKAIKNTFGPLLGDRLKISTIDELPGMIISCLRECGAKKKSEDHTAREIAWAVGDENIPIPQAAERNEPGDIFAAAMNTISW